MMGLESRPHLLEPVAALVGEVDLAQLLKQLPSKHLSSAIRPAETGDALRMLYPHEGTQGLDSAASELRSTGAANGAENPKTVSQ